jgi:hypothetical protein
MGQTSFSSSNASFGSVTVNAPAGGDGVVLTQNTDPLTIVALNSVSCNAGGLHADNNYLRRFDLDGEFGITNDLTVDSVDVGIETTTGAGGTQPISIVLHSIANGDAFLIANLTEIGRLDTTIADVAAVVQNFVVSSAAIDPATDDLVVDAFTPDGQTEGHTFFMGSNNLGQTAPSFLYAADCGIMEPTATGDIGFGDMHIVMSVNATVAGDDVVLPPPPAVPTMNSFGLLGMALALMLGAGLFLRRRA